MGFFSRRQKQPALPSDIISMMERFGRYEFNPQTSAYDGEDIGRLMAELYPFASTDPDGFLVALAEAVLPVGGWAVYGASRTIWELLSSSASAHQNPSYNAIMNAALAFLRTNGVSFMMLRGYEQNHWLASGGTMDTWGPRLPTASQVVTNPTNVPDSPEAWVKAGAAHMQNANYVEGLAAFERALQLNPAYAPAYAHKGAALTELDRYTQALAAYDRAIQLDPANAGFYADKGQVLAWLKRYD